ncbi:M10 family metallopeptidase C-terminal domain-containing protein [Microvirga calopogonii]|uniref:M10 family metallopeptidase C-terminal domain-containing protein n=1 Tax=Microvirga calopogonii TaxID=2078013 RepID=UPI0013B4083F|nr:calcium-binding protein [Microvirga calopogonii]
MTLTRTAPEWQKSTSENNYTPFAVLADGNIVVLQVRSGADAQDYIGQVYSPAGVAIGQSFLIKSFTGGNIDSRAVKALPDGRFAVAWEYKPDGSLATSYAETGIFNSDGSAFKAPIQIGSTNASFPRLTTLANGGYAMSYEDGGTNTIIFDRNGNPGTTSNISAWDENSIAGLRGGGFVTVVEEAAVSETGTVIKAYLRLPSGTATETLIKNLPDVVAPGQVGHVSPGASVVGLANGNFVVAWDEAYLGGSKAIKGQIVSSTGALIGGEVILHQDADGSSYIDRIEALPEGGFILGIADVDEGNMDAYIGTYSATGSVVTAPILAHQSRDGQQYGLDMEVLKDGSLLVGWLNFAQGQYTSHFQVFSTGYVAPPETDPSGSFGFTRLGTKGKDVLVGGEGDDKFYGGYGNDKLTGLNGADVFVFNSKLGTAKTDRKVNFDTITDFKPGEDKIWLDNAIFKKLGKAGTETAPAVLNKKFLKLGKQAGDKNDYIVYDKKTGILSYDADGSGAKEAIEIAKLAKNLKLSHLDFAIV